MEGWNFRIMSHLIPQYLNPKLYLMTIGLNRFPPPPMFTPPSRPCSITVCLYCIDHSVFPVQACLLVTQLSSKLDQSTRFLVFFFCRLGPDHKSWSNQSECINGSKWVNFIFAQYGPTSRSNIPSPFNGRSLINCICNWISGRFVYNYMGTFRLSG